MSFSPSAYDNLPVSLRAVVSVLLFFTVKIFFMPFSLTNKKHRLKIFVIVILFGLLPGCVKDVDRPRTATEESADVVYDWYKLLSRIQLRSNPAPVVLLNVRNFGYIGVGLYEAVQPGIKGARSLSSVLYQMPPMPEPEGHKDYLWGASANALMSSLSRQILSGLTDADRVILDSLENAYNNRFRLSVSDDVFSRSQGFGRAVATAIYNWSTTDNFNLANTGYVLPVSPSAWVPTPPANASPVGPFLMNSRPFLAWSLTATAPPLPFPFSTDPSSAFYKAVKEVYDIGKTLTDEQKLIANWWADAGGVGVGVAGGHHPLYIITSVLQSKNAKLGRAVEIYAKTGIALRDNVTIIFRSKFQFNLLRPVTYINRHIDASWQSYLPSPPYPEYLSGLVGVYAPAMQVMKREFGDIPITDNIYAFRGLPARSFPSITALVEEAAVSRVYAGIHYRFTQDATIVFGSELGNRVADLELISKREKDHFWK
jgi:hypothetical protein